MNYLHNTAFNALKGNYGKYPQKAAVYAIKSYFTGKGKPMSYGTPVKRTASGQHKWNPRTPAKKKRTYSKLTIGKLALARAIKSGQLRSTGGKRYVRVRKNKSNAARLRGRSRLQPGDRAIRSTWKRNAPRRNVRSGVTLKLLGDMLVPRVKFNDRHLLTTMEWGSEEQGYYHFDTFTRRDLEQLMSKLASTDIMRNGGALSVSETIPPIQLATAKCRFDSASWWDTVVNLSNHVTQVKYVVWKCRRPTNMTLQECWEKDKDVDDALTNTTAPIDIGQSLTGPNSYGTALWDKNLKYSYVKYYWKQEAVHFATLDCGEVKVFKHHVPAFTFDPAKADMTNQTAAGSTGTAIQFAFVPGITRQVVFVGRAQIVADNLDALVGHGSGKLGLSRASTLFARGCPAQPTYQTVNTGTLETITFSQQRHVNTDTGAQSSAHTIGT